MFCTFTSPKGINPLQIADKMNKQELKTIIELISNIDCVNYAEIDHANEQVKISIKPFKTFEFNFSINKMRNENKIPNNFVYDTAYKTNVSIIAKFNYN